MCFGNGEQQGCRPTSVDASHIQIEVPTSRPSRRLLWSTFSTGREERWRLGGCRLNQGVGWGMLTRMVFVLLRGVTAGLVVFVVNECPRVRLCHWVEWLEDWATGLGPLAQERQEVGCASGMLASGVVCLRQLPGCLPGTGECCRWHARDGLADEGGQRVHICQRTRAYQSPWSVTWDVVDHVDRDPKRCGGEKIRDVSARRVTRSSSTKWRCGRGRGTRPTARRDRHEKANKGNRHVGNNCNEMKIRRHMELRGRNKWLQLGLHQRRKKNKSFPKHFQTQNSVSNVYFILLHSRYGPRRINILEMTWAVDMVTSGVK